MGWMEQAGAEPDEPAFRATFSRHSRGYAIRRVPKW